MTGSTPNAGGAPNGAPSARRATLGAVQTITYEWAWPGGHPTLRAADIDRDRATDPVNCKVTQITVTTFPGSTEAPSIDVRGRRIKADGTDDRRFSYQARCWVSDEITGLVIASLEAGR